MKQGQGTNKTLEQIKYALAKEGVEYDSEAKYVLTTPKAVPGHISKGFNKVTSFTRELGEKMVVMSDQIPVGKDLPAKPAGKRS